MATAKKANKRFEGDLLIIDFANEANLQADLNSFSDEIKHKLAMHGLSQKVGDSYAKAGDADEAYGYADRVVQDLLAGNWTTRSAAGPKTTQLAQAVSVITGKTMEEVVTMLETMEDDAKKELRKHPQVQLELSKIKAAAAEAAQVKAAEAAATAAPLQF